MQIITANETKLAISALSSLYSLIGRIKFIGVNEVCIAHGSALIDISKVRVI